MKRFLSMLFVLSMFCVNSYSEVIEELTEKVLEEIIYVDPEVKGGTQITMYSLCGSGVKAWSAWYMGDKVTELPAPDGKSYPCLTEQDGGSMGIATERITKYTITIPERFQDGLSYYASWSKYGASSPCGKIDFWKHFIIRYATAFQYKETKNVHHMTAPVGSKVRIAPNDVRVENYFVKSDENATSLIQADSFAFVKKHKGGVDEYIGANYGKKDNVDYAAWMAYEYKAPSLPSRDTIECWAYKGTAPLCKVETFYMEYKDSTDVGPSEKNIIAPSTLRTFYKESFETYETTADYSSKGLGRDPISHDWISLSGLFDGSQKNGDACKTTHTVPSRGEYAIVKEGVSIYDNEQTAKDGNYLLYVDAGNTITKYYEKVIPNMCAGVSLQFSAWLYASLNKNGGSYPNLKFVIRNADTEEEIASYVTGEISSVKKYRQYGFEMKVPDNTPNLKFEIWNNTLATAGNDVAIDDIEISLVERELGTIINYSQDQVVSACSDLNTISFSGTLEDSPYNRTYYKWQVCPGENIDENGWVDFTDLSERPQYDIPPSTNAEPSYNEDGTPHVVTGFYRLIAGDYRSVSTNIMQCVQISKSNKVTLQKVTLSLESEYGQQNVCNEGNNGSVEVLVSGGEFPYTFSFSGRKDT